MNDDTRLMQKRASLVMLLGLLAVSSGAILTKLLQDVHPLVIAAYRLGIAGIIVLPLGICYGKKELLRLDLKNWLSLALAGFFLALHFGTWITSLSYTTVASSVILVNTSPIWVALMSPVILGEKLQRREKLGIISSVIGAFIIGFGDISLDEKALWGDVLALVVLY